MPIGLGLASSHAPGMYTPKDQLVAGFTMVNEWASHMGALLPSAFSRMNQADLEAHWQRFRNAHAALRKQLESFNPDALIIVGGDQSEMFDNSNKANMMIYTGSDAFGLNSGLMFAGMTGEQYLTHYKCDMQLSKWILNELITREGFDITASDEMRPLGNVMGRPANGLPHAFINPAEIMPRPDLPTILIYENTYDPPAMLSASRCYQLGQALARIMEKSGKRIAIYGSGGLSHDIGGPRTMWIDEPLDHWGLDQLTCGNGQALESLYTFDSATLRSGTGEIRAWVTVAGAMEYKGAKATVVDYIPAHETQTGCGFAYWAVPQNTKTII